ncbi:gamma-glutamyl-gamma-aminobutyrate hydrolase family protein [Parvimonas parva]|uniref:Gamma-glutamyl-gamma-aminobutyrate hydrolase family protein n=1 Tax=Parvimonas parva TaxID=2769485 RepID=A0ABS1C815_9FIRM|nr:gamma-glutamyl-gamma-aminobutyrate hydrolase family protein [Parvimonas parva]MBK1468034.1 gamma-glutamyl-gamma-aminobutyrate hydrolase family protein [Parvimonas parva]
MKPVIGISGSILINKGNAFSGYRRSYVNQDYVEAVLRAGAIPFIIPFNEDLEATREMVEKVDGIILSGGHDVNPYYYGEDPMLKIGELFPERDVFDMELYKTAIELKKPIFGICRGYQIINVINGGTLYQDLSYADFVKIKHDQVDNPTQATHFVELEEGTFLKNILGEKYKVNSFHHQILKDVAPGFKVVAKSSDGVIESIEKITEDSFVIGVQWHPEMLSASNEKSQAIFNAFVKKVIECKK